MTNEEAVNVLKDAKITYIAPNGKRLAKEALEMAISTLSNESAIQTENKVKQTALDILDQKLTEEYDKAEGMEKRTLKMVFEFISEAICEAERPTKEPLRIKVENPEIKVDLISRRELLNAIWQKEYGIDYDGVNLLNIKHIDIIENMPSYNSIKNELNGDLISRQAVLDRWDELSVRGRTEFDQAVMMLPSAEKTAEWLIDEHIDENAYCSNCGFYMLSEYVKGFKYCPNCGRFMREGELK